jgi:nitroreductase
MDFHEVLAKRRMVRNYDPTPVEREVIERILEVARRAPSAGFTQGQSFLAVTDPATRKAIADLAGEADYVASGFDPWLSRAPVHVIVCVSEVAYHSRYREPDKVDEEGREIDWPVPYWWVDAGASMMLLLLAAVDEGLAAGFFGFHRLDGLKELLSIPADVEPIGVVTLGRPAPDRRSASLKRGRKPSAEAIRWERWS